MSAAEVTYQSRIEQEVISNILSGIAWRVKTAECVDP